MCTSHESAALDSHSENPGTTEEQVLDPAVIVGDALDAMRNMESASVHLIATDPPYFIDGMGSDWNKASLGMRTRRAGVIGSLPVGMKFDPRQAIAFQAFMDPIAKEAMRVLYPGGFFIAFSQARLYHRLAIAAENAGFEIRDMMAWTYEGQAKAFSMEHFVRKMAISQENRERLLISLGGRKTPQLKPQMEPMVLAQRPRDGTFVANWMTHGTGLIDTTVSLDGKFPGNLMPVPKPSKQERGEGNDHVTVKPVRLMEHIIRLFSAPGQRVLDPFVGSGTTGIAAIRAGRDFLGVEIDPAYARIASARITRARIEQNKVSHAG